MSLQSASINILHLTDIHMGELPEINFRHVWKYKNGSSEMAEVVADVLKEHNLLNNHTPLYMVVSGDLVCNGAVDEQHKNACKALRELCTKINITNRARVFIVPGNHDVNRKDTSQRMMFHNSLFIQQFYAPPKWDDEDSEELQSRFLHPEFGCNTWEKPKWIYSDPKYKIAFILLYSQHPRAGEKHTLPGWIQKYLPKNGHEFWEFDRGLIEDDQFKAVEEEKRLIPDWDSYTKVVVFHHNPLPVWRPGVHSDNYTFIDTNLLGNGPETLKRIQSWGVSLVLHGHRHQNCLHLGVNDNPDRMPNAIVQDNLVVLGAPSIGATYPGDTRFDKDRPWIPPKDWIGFNHITIDRYENRHYLKLRRFTTEPVAPPDWKREDRDITLFKNNRETNIFLNFKDGLEMLGEQMLKANKGVTLLNYHSSSADWQDSFSKLWKPVLDEPLFTSFMDVLEYSVTKDQVQKYLQGTLDSGSYTPEFAELLRYSANIAESLRTKVTHGNSFLEHINKTLTQVRTAYPRKGNYPVELLRCAISKEYFIHKCIYFYRADSLKVRDDDRQGKFKWMLDSIVSACSLKNFHLAWLPFAIRDYQGESLVSAMFSPHADAPQQTPTTILVGYGKEREDWSVLYLDHEKKNFTPGGMLYNSLGALMRKIIYPLSLRLLDDFPIYRDGEVHLCNICELARLYECEQILNKYKKTHSHIFKKGSDELTVTLPRIKELYDWIAPGSGPLSIPWDSNDYDYIKRKLNAEAADSAASGEL
jgi:hypothetical protein